MLTWVISCGYLLQLCPLPAKFKAYTLMELALAILVLVAGL